MSAMNELSPKRSALPTYRLHNNEKLFVTGILPGPMAEIREGELATVIWSVYEKEENVYIVLSVRPEVSPGDLVSRVGLETVRVKIVASTDPNVMYGTQITVKRT